MRQIRMAAVVAAGIALIFALSACGAPRITYVNEGNSYTRASALQLAADTASGKLAETPTEQSKELRSNALAQLRNDAEGASQAATLITSTLPQESKSVPFYVERADYEGTDAVLVIEAIGRSGGTLSDKRLWVLSEAGDVLLSGTR